MYVLFVVIFRYSAVRRQFGPPGKDEIPVLEYQMQVGFSLDMSSIIIFIPKIAASVILVLRDSRPVQQESHSTQSDSHCARNKT